MQVFKLTKLQAGDYKLERAYPPPIGQNATVNEFQLRSYLPKVASHRDGMIIFKEILIVTKSPAKMALGAIKEPREGGDQESQKRKKELRHRRIPALLLTTVLPRLLAA